MSTSGTPPATPAAIRTRALVSVYDKTGLEELARGLHEAGVDDRVDRLDRRAHRRGRRAGDRGRGADRVPRVPRRPGQDAAPAGARRPARRPAARPSTRAARRARASSRSSCVVVQPLPVRGDRRVRRDAGRVRRADRHRRPVDGPRAAAKNHAERRGGASTRRATPTCSPRSRPAASRCEQRQRLAAEAFAHTATYDVAVASWMGSVVAPDDGAGRVPGWVGGDAGARRRCCATARTRTSGPRSTRRPPAPGLAAGRAAARQGDVLQQLRRRRRGLAGGVRLHRAVPSRSSSTPTRAASRSAPTSPRRTARRTPATRCRRSAASSRPTARSPSTLAEQVAEVFTEVVVAPAFEPTALSRCCTRKKNMRLLRAPPPRPRPASSCGRSAAACWCRPPTRSTPPGDDPADWTLATGERRRRRRRCADLEFAWRAVPRGEVQRDPARRRRRDGRRRHGPGQPGRLGRASRSARAGEPGRAGRSPPPTRSSRSPTGCRCCSTPACGRSCSRAGRSATRR